LRRREFIIKMCFYFISLSPLFFLLAILKGDISRGCANNTFAILCLSSCVLAFVGLIVLGDISKDAKKLPMTISKIENINYENLTFLATYIIPLVVIPLDTRKEKIVFIILLFFIGLIFVRTNIFYMNPSLAILGFAIYRVNDTSGKYMASVIIIHGALNAEDIVKCLPLGDNVYYGRKLK